MIYNSSMSEKMFKTKIEKYTNPKSLLTYFFYILFCVFLLLYVVKCISIVKTTTFSFDGAMNALAVHSLFGSENNLYNGYPFFDHRVQTGIPVTGLVAISFSLFGESFEAGLLVNLIYTLLFVLVIVYYLHKCLKLNFFYVSIAFLLFISTRQLFYHAFGLYGELPALTFFMMSLVVFHKFLESRKNQLLTLFGVLLGLSVLTKTVMLITVPAYLVTIITLFIVESWKLKDVTKFIWRSLSGFFAPLFIFELIKFLSLGRLSYIRWWQTASIDIGAQAGLSDVYQDTPGIIDKLLSHLNNLSINVDLPVWAIILTLSFLLFGLIWPVLNIVLDKLELSPRKKRDQILPLDVLTLLLVTLSYFGWWLLITPTQKAMFRRIINGVYLINFCLPILFFYFRAHIIRILGQHNQHYKTAFSVFSVILSVFLMVFGMYRTIKFKNFDISFTNSDLKTTYLTSGEIIHNLPENSTIYGTGWWQAPILSFSAKRDFYNIDPLMDQIGNSPLSESYLVSDHYEFLIDPKAPYKILESFEYQVLFSLNKVEIFELIQKLP